MDRVDDMSQEIVKYNTYSRNLSKQQQQKHQVLHTSTQPRADRHTHASQTDSIGREPQTSTFPCSLAGKPVCRSCSRTLYSHSVDEAGYTKRDGNNAVFQAHALMHIGLPTSPDSRHHIKPAHVYHISANIAHALNDRGPLDFGEAFRFQLSSCSSSKTRISSVVNPSTTLSVVLGRRGTLNYKVKGGNAFLPLMGFRQRRPGSF